MRKPKSMVMQLRKERRLSENEEVSLLNEWIEAQKPDSGTNPLSAPLLPRDAPLGRLADGSFSPYAGATKFSQLPLSKKTKDGLKTAGFVSMSKIQRASLPHSLCGRDVLGAAKTGSGKTLAFIIPVLEKLHRERWSPEFGVGCIIISPTRELASQLFDVLKAVGKYHGFSAGLLIGGRKDIDEQKEHVNELNILVCTPGRLLQHMDETPNFDCSQLQILVLDEADRILDAGFKKDLNAIVSQLPKHRQTFLFSATQTKSVQDLARLSLKDPEYLSVHEEATTATPGKLQQTAMIVPLDQKLDMLWSFVKAHLNSKILVFLSSCKQVKFVFEAFKKLRPGIPLKCLHGRIKQDKRMGIYYQFCNEKRSVLFCTDVASRGLDFNKAVDWVVQVDCPDDVASYIHRVGRTARYKSAGKSVVFLMPSEMKMLENLKAAKVPVQFIKANTKRVQPVKDLLKGLLAQHPDLQYLAQRAFVTYLRSIHIHKDKEVFDVMKLNVEDYSASMGLPMTPKIRFLNQKKNIGKKGSKKLALQLENTEKKNSTEVHEVSDIRQESMDRPVEKLDIGDSGDENADEGFLLSKDDCAEGEAEGSGTKDIMPLTHVSKKKKMKLKINNHRPTGTKVVFDEEGDALPPLAMMADRNLTDTTSILDTAKREEFYQKLRKDFKHADKEDKFVERQRRREKRLKQKMKLRKGAAEEELDGDDEEDLSGSEGERMGNKKRKRSKIYFDIDDDDDTTAKTQRGDNATLKTDSVSLAEQEALALKLLSSMH